MVGQCKSGNWFRSLGLAGKYGHSFTAGFSEPVESDTSSPDLINASPNIPVYFTGENAGVMEKLPKNIEADSMDRDLVHYFHDFGNDGANSHQSHWLRKLIFKFILWASFCSLPAGLLTKVISDC